MKFLVLFIDFKFHLSEIFEFCFYRNVENEVDISFGSYFCNNKASNQIYVVAQKRAGPLIC